MTDNEIITALECCSHRNEDLPCEGCPAYSIAQMCTEDLMSDALDLINRQKSEIERYLHSIKLLENDVATAKSEAIKEFAEKLKMECYATYDEVLPSLFADIIDKLVKEMTECDGK